MTPEMEDYARLARVLTMSQNVTGTWVETEHGLYDGDFACMADDLPAYLAEPAQMSRILRAQLPGTEWILQRWRDEKWMARRWLAEGGIAVSWADTPEEAVRDAAALALRERA
jgi:hypothetical protein